MKRALKVKGGMYDSGHGYKGVKRMGSKYGWSYEDGRTSQKKGGFDTPEEAAYNYDEFLLHYVGPNADTNQALGLLKLKHVLEIREKIRASERPVNKADKRHDKLGAAGYRGVSANKSKNKPFKSQTYLNGKYIHIGTFATAEEAARAFDDFMLKHHGNDAITNIKLGLLPPVGESVKLQLTPIPEEVEEQPESNVVCMQTFTNTYRTPEDERQAQIEAARAMAEAEEEENEPDNPTVKPAVESESNVMSESFMGEKSAPASIQSTEVILMSEGDKLRQQAEALLRQAAEADAGNIKRNAAIRLEMLSETVGQIQSVLLSLIDCCAKLETDIQDLKALLK